MSMETKHAPGPWTLMSGSGSLVIQAVVDLGRDQHNGTLRPIYEVGIRPTIVVLDNGRAAVQICYESWCQFPDLDFQAMQKANANLIAAAPELLAVLKEAHEYLDPNPLNSIGTNSTLHTKFREAIAKAEGRTL